MHNEESFKDNDENVLFLTGLSTRELLHVLFQHGKRQLKQHSIFNPPQQLMVALMRLRFGLSGQDLAIVLGLVVPPLAEPSLMSLMLFTIN